MVEGEELELSEWVKTLLRILSPSVPTIPTGRQENKFVLSLSRDKNEMLV